MFTIHSSNHDDDYDVVDDDDHENGAAEVETDEDNDNVILVRDFNEQAVGRWQQWLFDCQSDPSLTCLVENHCDAVLEIKRNTDYGEVMPRNYIAQHQKSRVG